MGTERSACRSRDTRGEDRPAGAHGLHVSRLLWVRKVLCRPGSNDGVRASSHRHGQLSERQASSLHLRHLLLMGYRCWLMSCSEEIPDKEEVWRDWYGKVVDWSGRSGIPVDPAPFHPTCPRPVPPPGSTPPGGAPDTRPVNIRASAPLVKGTPKTRKDPSDSFDINNLPSPKKPDQMKLF